MLKKLVKWGAVTALGLVVFLVAGGLMIDPVIELDTERVVVGDAAALYPMISEPAGVVRWWSDAAAELGGGQPAMDVAVVDESRVRFSSAGSTLETWTRVGLAPLRSAGWDVDFAGMMTVRRTLTLTPRDDGTTLVRWHESGRIGNPVFRWFKLLMPADSVVANFHAAIGLLEKRAAVK